MDTGQTSDTEAFFRYTSGRWLWDEQARLQERYRRFNVPALQKIAASTVNAQSCVSMVKLGEGGFNKIFHLTMNNGAVVIARIPNLNSGPLFQTVASEVATMDLASTILGIPVPKILAWSAKAENPVQSEYILMEEATGTQLGKKWHSMDIEAKLEVVDELVSITKKLLSVSFSRYGNIYFSNDYFPGCERVHVQGSLPAELKADVESRYVIGPAVERSFWDGERREISGVRGPWSTPQDYIKAIANREIIWLSKYADPQMLNGRPFQPKAQMSPEAHIALYRKLLTVADDLLPTDQDLVRSTLWHWDLHSPNIFVSGNKITGLIDWQDCWAGPLMLQGRRPRLVDFQGELTLQLPPHYKSLEEGEEKEQIRSTVEKSILLFSYESQTQHENPVLDRIFRLPQGPTIRDTVLFAANTWDGGLIPFRECLYRIYRNWDRICPGRKCPFEFTPDDLSVHVSEGENWNENADFWSSVSELVGRDGFVANEDYDEALGMFARLREEGIQTLDGDERADFELATRWATNIRRFQEQTERVLTRGSKQMRHLNPTQVYATEGVKNESIDPYFYACAEADEEAILNGLVGGRSGTVGMDGTTVEGFPVDKVKELLDRHLVKV